MRKVKIKGEANPYDPQWESYFEERTTRQMQTQLQGQRKLLNLWKKQEGICPICHQLLEDRWEIHHKIRRVDGGKETIENLVLLHVNCHRQIHAVV